MDLADMVNTILGNSSLDGIPQTGTSMPDELTETMGLINKSGVVPNIKTGKLPSGRSGEYNLWQNNITIGDEGHNINTVTHELTHALDRSMYLDARKLDTPINFNTPIEDQFVDAYKKLDPATTKLPLETDEPYRNKPAELRAFGVGNMVDPKNNVNSSLPHVDATMATEAAIMRDLYSRMLNARDVLGKKK